MKSSGYDALNFERSKQQNNCLVNGLRTMSYSIWQLTEQHLMLQYKAFLELLLESERDMVIEERQDENMPKEWLYRNGTTTLRITTRLSSIEIERPQLRKTYQSFVVPQYTRNEQALLELVTDLYTVGVSTRKIETALASILKESISASKVSIITNKVKERLYQFHHRPIEDDYVYLYLDGIPIKAKHTLWTNKRGHMVIVAYGVRRNGIKEIIDFRIAKSEGATQCSGFLFNLYERGLKGQHLKLIITDGSQGLHNAIDEIYPTVLRQRCWVHKLRNLAIYIPKDSQAACLAEAKKIYLATSHKHAFRLFKKWEARWYQLAPKAVACLGKDIEELLNFFHFDKEHWVKLRTTNPIERAFREFRRRTKVMDNYLPSLSSCEKLFFVLTEFLNKRWKTKRFLIFPCITNIPKTLPLRVAA